MTSPADAHARQWFDQAREKLGGARLGPQANEIGRVEEIGDGVENLRPARTCGSMKSCISTKARSASFIRSTTTRSLAS